MTDRDNVIGLYSAKAPTDAQKPETERVPYSPVDISRIDRRPPMMRLYYPTGILELIPYGLILDVEMGSSRDLGILLTTGAVYFEGENFLANLKNPNDEEGLLTLVDVLQMQRAWAFRCFNPDIHLQHAADEPVIYNLKFESKTEFHQQ